VCQHCVRCSISGWEQTWGEQVASSYGRFIEGEKCPVPPEHEARYPRTGLHIMEEIQFILGTEDPSSYLLKWQNSEPFLSALAPIFINSNSLNIVQEIFCSSFKRVMPLQQGTNTVHSRRNAGIEITWAQRGRRQMLQIGGNTTGCVMSTMPGRHLCKLCESSDSAYYKGTTITQILVCHVPLLRRVPPAVSLF
jgi:hypothetical protein